MEEFPSPPLPPMYSPKTQEQQVRGERHPRKQGLKVPKAKCFSSSDIDSLALYVTCVYSCKKTPCKTKAKSHRKWKMRDSFCQLSQ